MSEKFTVARLTKENEHFEILVKPQKALDYRNGKIAGITEVLAAEIIFSDANKGTKVSEESMHKAFGTIDALKIADTILKKGTLQLTTEQRRKMVEDKRRQVIDFIADKQLTRKQTCRILQCASRMRWSKSVTQLTPTSQWKNKQET